ncbi:MAG: DUF2284 domain-containing protein [Eubacteriales bacterium]|nr:DUF2284 domain-containing protein [Eubacteriales bacterium]
MAFQEYSHTLIQAAIDQGAVNAVRFDIEDILFDPRTLLKCMFGCEDWGKGHTCPSRPNNISLREYEQMLKRYRWGVLVHAHDKRTTQRISYALESQAFAAGYYFAFSMSDCAICEECSGRDGLPCRDPRRARPAFHSVGIDVFATVRALGLPIETLSRSDQQQNWYAAVFVE